MLSQLGSKSCERVSGNWQDTQRWLYTGKRERSDEWCGYKLSSIFSHCLFEMGFKVGFSEKFHDVTDYILFLCQRSIITTGKNPQYEQFTIKC